MSDEQPPPSLRLKPRIRLDGVNVPPPAAPKPAVATPLQADGILKPPAGGAYSFSAINEGEPKAKRFSVPAASSGGAPAVKRLPMAIAPVAEPETEPSLDGGTDAETDSGLASSSEAVAETLPETESEMVPAQTTESEPPLDGQPETETETPYEDDSAPPVEPPTRFSIPAPSSDAGDMGRFKLKPRLNLPDAPALGGAMSPPMPGGPSLSPPPGMKIVPTAPTAVNGAPSFAKPSGPARPSPNSARKLRRVVVRRKSTRALKFVFVTLGLVVAAGIAVGGFLLFRFVAQIEKHPETNVAVFHASAVKKPLPGKPEGNEETESIPEKTAAQPSETAAQVNPSPNQIAAAPNGTTEPNKAGATGVKTPDGAVAAAIPVKPVVHSPPTPRPNPVPSSEFRTLVVNLHVSGVFQGEPARALLNGRLMSAGEMLDNTLIVRFTGVDAAHKLLLFEDSTGAVMQRRY